MPQDAPTTFNRIARAPAAMARVGVRLIPIVAVPSTIYEGIMLIDALIPAQHKIETHIGNLRSQAESFAPGGDGYLRQSQLAEQYPEAGEVLLGSMEAQSHVFADTADQIALQALPGADEAHADALTHRMNETNRLLGQAASSEEVDEILAAYREESARQEEEFRQALAQQTIVPPPPEAEGDVRIAGQCRRIVVCFWPGEQYRRNPLRREYERQLRNQQDGINAMLPQDLVQNYDTFQTPAGRAAAELASNTSRTAVRGAYRRAYRSYLRSVTPGTSSANPYVLAAANASVEARLARHMRRVAALHNPDSIAGGNPTIIMSPQSIAAARFGRPIPEIGHRGTNSSIGNLWNRAPRGHPGQTRAERLVAHARQQAALGCGSTQVELAICQGLGS
ncbi:polymorphic toxin type 15 domain-containing protein [Gymnodinialimonas sp. 2305UL16-5]|uniref:polymorphic toxin type 15 domain-containing protein n=1 Tax=Gymnodinialimonas mytili TaxID=3126503 RepID=UPI0030A18B0C